MNRMSVKLLLFILSAATIIGLSPVSAWPDNTALLGVELQPPNKILKMGDTPSFRGTVTNLGKLPVHGLVVYLSLVSLLTGEEQPVDLEDWSAQKAYRIDRLDPGKAVSQNWGMRLIQAGSFGVALTVIDPKENRPVISELIPFTVIPKPTISSTRILPVAIGEPLIFLALLAAYSFSNYRSKRKRPN
jgi:hypothetical protein